MKPRGAMTIVPAMASISDITRRAQADAAGTVQKAWFSQAPEAALQPLVVHALESSQSQGRQAIAPTAG
jgi:hypothetical protein